MATSEVKADGGEALVEATDDVEDERAIGDRFTEVTKGVGYALETMAVLSDRRSSWQKFRNSASRKRSWVSLLPRNWDSMASQAALAVEPRSRTEAARSLVTAP